MDFSLKCKSSEKVNMTDRTVSISKVPVYSIEGLLGLKKSSAGDKIAETKIMARRQNNNGEEATNIGKALQFE